MKITKVVVRYSKADIAWVVYATHHGIMDIIVEKSKAVRTGRYHAKILTPSKLIIKKKNGEIQSEQNYD